MSNALIVGFIAVGVSAATVIGLETTGIAKSAFGSGNDSSSAVIADDEENDPEALKLRITELEDRLETLSNDSAKNDDVNDLRADVIKIDERANDAYTLAASRAISAEGVTVGEDGADPANIELIVKDALDKARAEEKALAEAEKKKKAEEHKIKQREQFVERTTKTFQDLQPKLGLLESTVGQAINVVVLGYDQNVGYNEDIKSRREQGQTVTEDEIKAERERIKTETNTALEMLFSKEQWVDVSKAVERIPREMGDNRGNETPRASQDSPRGSKPKGDGGARR